MANDPYVARLRPDQVQEITTAFMEFDANRNGVITPGEMKECLRRSNIQYSDAEVDRVMANMDLNHDGSVTYDEYMKFMARVYLGDQNQPVAAPPPAQPPYGQPPPQQPPYGQPPPQQPPYGQPPPQQPPYGQPPPQQPPYGQPPPQQPPYGQPQPYYPPPQGQASVPPYNQQPPPSTYPPRSY